MTPSASNTHLRNLAALAGVPTTGYVGPVLHEAFLASLAGTPESRLDAFGAVSAAYGVTVDAVMRWHETFEPDFSTVQPGLLPAGTVTEQGTIAGSTLTAYEMADGSFVAFQRVHGRPEPVMPLVVFR